MKIKKVIIERFGYDKVNFNNPLPVNWNHNCEPDKIFGQISIEEDKDNKCYVGELEFIKNKYTENQIESIRKLILNKFKVYPSIGGRVIKRDGDIITEIEIDYVSLGTSNVDSTIPPLELEENE